MLQYYFGFTFWCFGCKSCGILTPQPGTELTPPALEGEVLITGPPGRSTEWPHILKLNRESLLLLIKDCDYWIGPFMHKVQSWSLLEEVGRMVTLEGWVVPEGDMSGLWKASHVLYIDLEADKCVCSVCEKILKTPLTVWALFSLFDFHKNVFKNEISLYVLMKKDLQGIQVTKKKQCLYYYRLMYIFIIMHIHIYSWTKVIHMWMYGGGGGLAAKCVQLCVTPWTVAHQAPLSRGFPRQEYWSCRLFLQGVLPDQGLNSCIAGGFFYWWATREAHVNVYSYAYGCVYLYLYMQRKYLRVHTQNSLPLRRKFGGTSLVVQWLRLCTHNAEGTCSSPGQGTRSHMLQLKKSCMLQWRLKIPHAAIKTWCSQINK